VTISNPDLLSSSTPGLLLEYEAENNAHQIKLEVRKPLVVSISQKREELRLYNIV
jgi:hypothetical protein